MFQHAAEFYAERAEAGPDLGYRVPLEQPFPRQRECGSICDRAGNIGIFGGPAAVYGGEQSSVEPKAAFAGERPRKAGTVFLGAADYCGNGPVFCAGSFLCDELYPVSGGIKQ